MNPHLNIDELYESKKKNDLNRLEIYNKLLVKVHTRIKTASRLRNCDNFCHFIMPEILVGYPNYNLSDCVVFIIDCLEKDGFLTRYVHPNLLLISWNHWVPNYVREEYKKQTGISINSYGESVKEKNTVQFDKKEDKKFIYDSDMLSSIRNKL